MSNKFILLPDTPNITETSFGAHKRIAGGLASMIENGTDGLTVAIEGEWGSGKSTVIHLLKEKLKENEDICFVEFDAWVNLGDPVRRAFLSRVISTLRKQPGKKSGSVWLQEKISNEMLPWVKNQKAAVDARDSGKETTWEIIQEEMVQKRDAKENKVSIGWLGFIFIFGLLVAGFVQVLKLVSGDAILKGGLNLWQGIILLLLALAYFGYISYIKKDKNKFGELLELVGRFKQEDMTIGISSGNPTIIEFQFLFKLAVKSALWGMRNETNKADEADHDDEEKKKRKLVLVLDNIDRVDQATSENLWSLIRTFVDSPEISSESWAKRIWILVPVFQRKQLGESSGEIRSAARTPSFHEKVFQASVFVPRPHSKNIEGFLKKKLEAASITEDKDITALSIIYRSFSGKGEDFGAGGDVPRTIIRFVNDVVTKCYVWSGQEFTKKDGDLSKWNPAHAECQSNRLKLFATYQLLSRSNDFSERLALNELLDGDDLKHVGDLKVNERTTAEEQKTLAHNLLGAIHFNEDNLDEVQKQLENRKKPMEYLWGDKLITDPSEWERLLGDASSKAIIFEELSKIYRLSDIEKGLTEGNIILNISEAKLSNAYFNILTLSAFYNHGSEPQTKAQIVAKAIETKMGSYKADNPRYKVIADTFRSGTNLGIEKEWIQFESDHKYTLIVRNKSIELAPSVAGYFMGNNDPLTGDAIKAQSSHRSDEILTSPRIGSHEARNVQLESWDENRERSLKDFADSIRATSFKDSAWEGFEVEAFADEEKLQSHLENLLEALCERISGHGDLVDSLCREVNNLGFWIWLEPLKIAIIYSNADVETDRDLEDRCLLIRAIAHIKIMESKKLDPAEAKKAFQSCLNRELDVQREKGEDDPQTAFNAARKSMKNYFSPSGVFADSNDENSNYKIIHQSTSRQIYENLEPSAELLEKLKEMKVVDVNK